MDNKLATAILKEAQSGGFMTEDIPESVEERATLAQEWAEEALRSQKEGMKHPTVLAIVNMLDSEQLEQGNTAVADVRGEEPDPGSTAVPEREGIQGTYPRRSSGGLSESDEREAETFVHPILGEMDETDMLAFKNKLPIPQEFDDEPSVMPRDLTEVGDKQIRRLSSEYQAYLNRARWLQAIALSDLANSEHLFNHEYRRAYKEFRSKMMANGERPTKDAVDSFAQEDKQVLVMSDNVRKHENEVTAYTALVKIYEGNVDRLSREATLRQYEWERSR